MDQHLYKFYIIAALIMFSIYRRIRRNIGWQQLNPRKIKVRAGIFIIIGLLFLVGAFFHPISLISDLVGILIGMGLAYYSIKKIRFEWRDSRWYYLQNTLISMIVIALFFGRLLYRFYQVYALVKTSGLRGGQLVGLQNMNNISNSWTAGLMLIMFAYYVIYYINLLRIHRQLSQSGENMQ